MKKNNFTEYYHNLTCGPGTQEINGVCTEKTVDGCTGWDCSIPGQKCSDGVGYTCCNKPRPKCNGEMCWWENNNLPDGCQTSMKDVACSLKLIDDSMYTNAFINKKQYTDLTNQEKHMIFMMKDYLDSYFCPQDNPQECMPCQKDYVKYLFKLFNDAPDMTENQVRSLFVRYPHVPPKRSSGGSSGGSSKCSVMHDNVYTTPFKNNLQYTDLSGEQKALIHMLKYMLNEKDMIFCASRSQECVSCSDTYVKPMIEYLFNLFEQIPADEYREFKQRRYGPIMRDSDRTSVNDSENFKNRSYSENYVSAEKFNEKYIMY